MHMGEVVRQDELQISWLLCISKKVKQQLIRKQSKQKALKRERQREYLPLNRIRQRKKESVASAKCQFCGIKSASFAEGDNLDNHFLNQCLMLTNCQGCGQIVEISSLNAHYIKECTEKEQYKRCRTCKESFPKDAIDAPQREAKCNAQKPTSQANRYPLCHKDIGPLTKDGKIIYLVNSARRMRGTTPDRCYRELLRKKLIKRLQQNREMRVLQGRMDHQSRLCDYFIKLMKLGIEQQILFVSSICLRVLLCEWEGFTQKWEIKSTKHQEIDDLLVILIYFQLQT